jgi:hypothetical protein
MSPVLLWCVDIALVIFSVSLVLASWRLLVGPQVLDRVLALDTLYVNALAMLVLLGMRFGNCVAWLCRHPGAGKIPDSPTTDSIRGNACLSLFNGRLAL